MTIYDQLNTKTLGDVEAIDIQSLQDRVHIQEVNKEELETYNLINKATFRDGNPIPGTSEIKLAQATDSGVAVDVFQPAKGEVWALQAGLATVSGGSGDITHALSWTDTTNSRSFIWYSMTNSGSTPILSNDTNWLNDKYFDENIKLSYSATGTLTQSLLSIILFRVR